MVTSRGAQTVFLMIIANLECVSPAQDNIVEELVPEGQLCEPRSGDMCDGRQIQPVDCAIDAIQHKAENGDPS